MKWKIYGYKNMQKQKIEYIGQTSNLSYRRYRHEKYDPFNENIVEYNYPLSRGIRKHGLKNYIVIIIEDNIDSYENAINRESYWINYYNTYKDGYNQTIGEVSPKYIKFTKETIEHAKQQIKEGVSFEAIKIQTGISVPHLSEINTGKRHYNEDDKYPLYEKTAGRKLSTSDVYEIIELLSMTVQSQTSIGEKYGVTQTVISSINLGKKYKQTTLNYPIRKKIKPVSTIPQKGSTTIIDT